MTDIIFALATNIQRSALHIHRISGPDIFSRMLPYLKGKLNFQLSEDTRFPLTKYLSLFDENQTIIDDLIITFYRAPKSFTGEDMLELSCHGNPLISQKLQSFFRFLGFRDAKEGEFTCRAYLNGKLDLSQAEAIHELIQAETYAAIKLSRSQLNGALTTEINNLREKFIDILSYLEAHIDFSTEEIGNYEPVFLIPKLEAILVRLSSLKDSYHNGIKLKEGLKIVLCGKPNVGKSTLYNKLLNFDRAIVTDIAGTTRDVLTERLVIEQRDFILMDTAGLRNTKNIVEKLGVDRSLKALNEADIICFVIDGTKKIPKFILQPWMSQKKIIFVISKKDCIESLKIKKIMDDFKKYYPSYPIAIVSQNEISGLKSKLIQSYDDVCAQSNFSRAGTSPILISARCYDIVKESIMLLEEVFPQLENKDLPEKIASKLYFILKKLEEILGEVDHNKIYEKIFSTFCIGK